MATPRTIRKPGVIFTKAAVPEAICPRKSNALLRLGERKKIHAKTTKRNVRSTRKIRGSNRVEAFGRSPQASNPRPLVSPCPPSHPPTRQLHFHPNPTPP